MFDHLNKVIVGAAAIIALIPGASLLTESLQLPISFDKSLGFISAFVGPIVFFLVYMGKDYLQRQKRFVLMLLIGVTAMGGVGLFYWANQYGDERSSEYKYVDDKGVTQAVQYLVPESFGPKMTERLARDRGDLANAINRDRETVLNEIKTDAAPVRFRLMTGFLGAQILMIFAFLCAAWSVARMTEDARREIGEAK